jgi:hypothetical protein
MAAHSCCGGLKKVTYLEKVTHPLAISVLVLRKSKLWQFTPKNGKGLSMKTLAQIFTNWPEAGTMRRLASEVTRFVHTSKFRKSSQRSSLSYSKKGEPNMRTLRFLRRGIFRFLLVLLVVTIGVGTVVRVSQLANSLEPATAKPGQQSHPIAPHNALTGNPVVAGVQANNCLSFQPQGSLAAFNGWMGDVSERSVAVSGETAVVGLPYDTIGNFARRGSVQVFVRSGSTWSFQQQLIASDGARDDRFGHSVAISGDTIVVGAFLANIGNKADQGAAYVFQRTGTTWNFVQKLLAPDGDRSDYFGLSVSIHNDTILVGAPNDRTLLGFAEFVKGSAYVFVRGGGWSFQQKLVLADSSLNDLSGGVVRVNGDTALLQVGGAVYVWVRSGITWSQQEILLPPAGGGFGFSLALDGDTAAIGAPNETIGANSNQGAAYIFLRIGTAWSLQQKVMIPGGSAGSSFAFNLALSGNKLVASASGSGAVLGGGNLVYVFGRIGSVWNQVQLLTTAEGYGFSGGLALDGTVLAIVANGFPNRGLAHAFTCSPCPAVTVSPTTLPFAKVGLFYNQTITATGGTAPYSFTVSNGTLPSGLSLSSTGVLSGTPTTPGVASLSVKTTDANGCTGVRAYELEVAPPCTPLSITPSTLPAGLVGTPVNISLASEGGSYPYVLSLSAGSLPPGISLTSREGGGNLIGTPTNGGIYNFTLQVMDRFDCVNTQSYTWLIHPLCSPDLSPISNNVNASGGTFSFNVIAPSCTWVTIISAPWLTVTMNASGTGNATVTYSVAPNIASARIGLITVNNQNFTVNQAAGSPLQFYPLASPVRLLDTRNGAAACTTPNAPLTGGASRTQLGRGTCTIPANAVALTGNITTVQSGGGYLTIYPSDAAQPTVANSNYGVYQVVNNVFTTGLGAVDGSFKIFATTNTDVVVDVSGYYAPPSPSGLYFHPLPAPIRLLDTRPNATGYATPGVKLTGNADTAQLARGLTHNGVTIPATAQAIVGNATTVDPGGGWLTLYPQGVTRPNAASSNYNAGDIMNAPFTVGLSATGEFMMYVTSSTHMIVDVLGYYSADATDVNGTGLLFTPLASPVRLLDTRVGATGCDTPGAPLLAGSTRLQTASGSCTLPATAQAIVGNVTTVNPWDGYLTFFPSSVATPPFVATSNFTAGQIFNRHFSVGLGGDGKFKIYTFAPTDLVVDVSGYFTP